MPVSFSTTVRNLVGANSVPVCWAFANSHCSHSDFDNNICLLNWGNASEIFTQAAKTTKVPSLWLYSANDKYWGEDPPKQWFKAYQETAKAAGQTASSEFFAAPAVGENGHSMQVNGMKFWTPVVYKWLEQNRF